MACHCPFLGNNKFDCVWLPPRPLSNRYLLSMPGNATHYSNTPLRPPPTPPYHFDALYFCAMFVVLCLLPTARVKKCTPAQRISHFAMSAGKNKAKAATEIAAKRLNLNISL